MEHSALQFDEFADDFGVTDTDERCKVRQTLFRLAFCATAGPVLTGSRAKVVEFPDFTPVSENADPFAFRPVACIALDSDIVKALTRK